MRRSTKFVPASIPHDEVLILYHAQSVSHRIYCRVAWRGFLRVIIAFNDRSIDFPVQSILKQARAAKSRIGHERT